MKDILINNDGTPVIENGDLVETSYPEYVAQKVYAAIMSIGPGDITGFDETKPELIVAELDGYFADYFAGDPDVEVSGIDVTMKNRGGQTISIGVEYRGTSPDGMEISVTQGLDYDMTAGSLRSLDYAPAWLMYRDDPDTSDITCYVSVTDHTNDIELPLEPALSKEFVANSSYRPIPDSESELLKRYNEVVNRYASLGSIRTTSDPIYLCSATGSAPSSSTKTFSITIDTQTMLYPLSRYISGFTVGDDVILDATITEEPANSDIQLVDEYGELSIFVLEGTGTISGTATVATAQYATYDFLVKDPEAHNHVFKLKPTRGRYVAIFAKSVSPGTYMLQYRGNKERRIY